MKKQLLTLLAAGTVGSAFAQLPVSTTAQNKHIVLEEYTGIYCGYCPDGHSVANGIYAANPGSVLINIHTGGYATVAAGEPDLKSTIGDAIAIIPGMGITGYPAGDVNRTILTSTVMAAGRGSWSSMATTIAGQAAYCNVAVQGNVDATTRVLTYTAQVYYTGNSPATTNSLTVVLLEDAVLGPQHNYGNPLYNASNYNADGSYNHNHVLRKGLTAGNFGITIPVTTTGTTFTTTGSYTIPATYGVAGKTNPCLLGNIKLAAFVTETNTLTINGANGPVAITNVANAIDGGVSTLKADAETCAGNLQPSTFVFVNNGSTTITSAVINYSVTGGSLQAYNFAGSLAPFTQTVITLPSYAFTAGATNTLNVVIASVNGSADPVTTNNAITKSIPLTTKIANSINMSMIFTQDQYGSESTWTITDEVTTAVVASGGPYTDLAASGTSVQPTVNFVVSPNKCYKVTMNDAYGDGFNAGTGAGNYVIKSGGTTLYTMNGVMGLQDIKLFKTSATANGLNELSSTIANVAIYPNPAKNSATLELNLIQNETITINVLSVMGQVVFTQTLNNLPAGTQTIALNSEAWSNGIYNVTVSTSNGNVSRKLEIIK
jgi:hypothetical protein